jgi:hypothetical protein
MEEMIQGFKQCRQKSTSSPDGKYLGIYETPFNMNKGHYIRISQIININNNNKRYTIEQGKNSARKTSLTNDSGNSTLLHVQHNPFITKLRSIFMKQNGNSCLNPFQHTACKV